MHDELELPVQHGELALQAPQPTALPEPPPPAPGAPPPVGWPACKEPVCLLPPCPGPELLLRAFDTTPDAAGVLPAHFLLKADALGSSTCVIGGAMPGVH